MRMNSDRLVKRISAAIEIRRKKKEAPKEPQIEQLTHDGKRR